MREHVYVDGEGYADESAQIAERNAIHSCLQFLGAVMLVFFGFQTVLYVLMGLLFEGGNHGWIYYSERDAVTEVSSMQVYFYCALKVLAYVFCIVICHFRLKIPPKVALPNEKFRPKTVGMGICFSLLFLVISRVFDYVLVGIFSLVNIDVCFYSYMGTGEMHSQVVYYVTEIVVIPIIAEILFRGYIMQLFRQFGDVFAIFVTALTSAYIYHDITKVLFMFFFTLLLGALTVRTGSLKVSVITRISVAVVAYILNMLSIHSGNISAKFWECLISLVILIFAYAAILYMKRHEIRPFHFESDVTEYSTVDKMRQILNSNLFILWMIISLLTSILWVRFI